MFTEENSRKWLGNEFEWEAEGTPSSILSTGNPRCRLALQLSSRRNSGRLGEWGRLQGS